MRLVLVTACALTLGPTAGPQALQSRARTDVTEAAPVSSTVVEAIQAAAGRVNAALEQRNRLALDGLLTASFTWCTRAMAASTRARSGWRAPLEAWPWPVSVASGLVLRWEDAGLFAFFPNGQTAQIFLASATEEAPRTLDTGRLHFTISADGTPVTVALRQGDREVWRAMRRAP